MAHTSRPMAASLVYVYGLALARAVACASASALPPHLVAPAYHAKFLFKDAECKDVIGAQVVTWWQYQAQQLVWRNQTDVPKPDKVCSSAEWMGGAYGVVVANNATGAEAFSGTSCKTAFFTDESCGSVSRYSSFGNECRLKDPTTNLYEMDTCQLNKPTARDLGVHPEMFRDWSVDVSSIDVASLSKPEFYVTTHFQDDMCTQAVSRTVMMFDFWVESNVRHKMPNATEDDIKAVVEAKCSPASYTTSYGGMYLQPGKTSGCMQMYFTDSKCDDVFTATPTFNMDLASCRPTDDGRFEWQTCELEMPSDADGVQTIDRTALGKTIERADLTTPNYLLTARFSDSKCEAMIDGTLYSFDYYIDALSGQRYASSSAYQETGCWPEIGGSPPSGVYMYEGKCGYATFSDSACTEASSFYQTFGTCSKVDDGSGYEMTTCLIERPSSLTGIREVVGAMMDGPTVLPAYILEEYYEDSSCTTPSPTQGGFLFDGSSWLARLTNTTIPPNATELCIDDQSGRPMSYSFRMRAEDEVGCYQSIHQGSGCGGTAYTLTWARGNYCEVQDGGTNVKRTCLKSKPSSLPAAVVDLTSSARPPPSTFDLPNYMLIETYAAAGCGDAPVTKELVTFRQFVEEYSAAYPATGYSTQNVVEERCFILNGTNPSTASLLIDENGTGCTTYIYSIGSGCSDANVAFAQPTFTGMQCEAIVPSDYTTRAGFEKTQCLRSKPADMTGIADRTAPPSAEVTPPAQVAKTGHVVKGEMTLAGVTKNTFDAAKFSVGMAAAFGVKADLIQVLGVTEVSRRHLLAAGVKVDFQVAASDSADATSIASLIEAKAPEDMANALKTAGLPVTAVSVANLAPTNLDAPTPTPMPTPSASPSPIGAPAQGPGTSGAPCLGLTLGALAVTCAARA